MLFFANLTKVLYGLEPCYSVDGVTDWANIDYDSIPTSSDSNWDVAECDRNKNGYRLPTETEWEYAARGDRISISWGYAFSGIDVTHGNKLRPKDKDASSETKTNWLETDSNLDNYAFVQNGSRFFYPLDLL